MNYNDINSNRKYTGFDQMTDNFRRYNLFMQRVKAGQDPYTIEGYSKEEVDLFLSTANYDGKLTDLMNSSADSKRK